MRQHQVPLPCVQEIAAPRRKRVQPSFSDWREAGVGQVPLTARLRSPMGYNVTIYKSTKFHGTPHAREGEVELFWQDIDKIPFEKMRKGDKEH